jgi:hypothetical protein
MSEERVAVLDHAFVEDLRPADSCSLPQKFDRGGIFGPTPALWSLSN